MKHTIFALSILMGILLAAPARAQSTPYDCFSVYTFTGATAQTGQSNSSASAPCVAWRVTYTSTGFSSVTVAFQTSPDNSSWTTVPNTQCSTSPTTSCTFEGASPITDGVQGTGAYRIYSKYVRANVTSVTGSGSGQVVTYGYKGTSAAAAGGGSGSSASSPGIAFVDAALGNGVTDATSAIQSALDTSTIGTVMIPTGNYLFSGITIPEGKMLECVGSGTLFANALIPGTHPAVSQLTYTGSGIAIASGWSTNPGKMNVRSCNILKSGTLGGVGIQLDISVGSRIEGNLIKNFSTCVNLNGASAGDYFDEVTHNALECTVGVGSTSSGAAQVNSLTVSDNRINFANIGIGVCTGCRGWKIQRNDIECPSGSGGFGIYATGSGHTLDTNWVEPNSCNTATSFTAIYANGPNLVLNNYLADAESADWTNLSMSSATTVINPNLAANISGASTFFFPRMQLNAVNVASLPACSASFVSNYSTVANALAPIAGTPVVGGGSVFTAVFCNGTDWIVAPGSAGGVTSSGTTCTITAIAKGVITAASCI